MGRKDNKREQCTRPCNTCGFRRFCSGEDHRMEDAATTRTVTKTISSGVNGAIEYIITRPTPVTSKSVNLADLDDWDEWAEDGAFSYSNPRATLAAQVVNLDVDLPGKDVLETIDMKTGQVREYLKWRIPRNVRKALLLMGSSETKE